VTLPLEAINKASVQEKSIRHSHPSMCPVVGAASTGNVPGGVVCATGGRDPPSHPDKSGSWLLPVVVSHQPLDGHGPEPLGSLLQWRGGFSRRH